MNSEAWGQVEALCIKYLHRLPSELHGVPAKEAALLVAYAEIEAEAKG